MRTACPLLLAATLVFAAGCDQSEPNFDTPAPADLVPLAIGNEWVMEGRHIRTEHPDLNSSPPDRDLGIDTFRVVADTLIEGERWFQLDQVGRSGWSCHDGFFANRRDGLYAWSAESGAVLRAPSFLLPTDVPYPVDMGYFEADRTTLADPGSLVVRGETLSTQRVELHYTSYDEDDGRLYTLNDNVREIDEYVPGIGFAVSECAWVTQYGEREGDTQELGLVFTERYVLIDYTLAGRDG